MTAKSLAFLLVALFSLASAQTATASNSTDASATVTTSSPLPPGKCTAAQNDAILNATSALTSCLRALPNGAPASQACPCHNALIAGFNAAGCVSSSSSYLLSASQTHCLQSCAMSDCPAYTVQIVATNPPSSGASSAASTSTSGAPASSGDAPSDAPSDAATLFVSIFTILASIFSCF